MTTRLALDALHDFLTDPTTHNASFLMDIPSLYDILRHEYALHGVYSNAIMSVCRWIYKRGRSILDQLLVHESLPLQGDIQSEGSWKTVCLFISHRQTLY